MADFLVKMQLPSGGYKAYVGNTAKSRAPIIFNVGQDLLGMADAYFVTKKVAYRKSMIAAADYLLAQQNPNGSWNETNYHGNVHGYHSRVALALVKTYYHTKQRKYLTAAKKNLNWTVSLQRRNGWFEHADLPGFPEKNPITHSLTYTIEGLLFSGILLKEQRYVRSALKTLKKLEELYKEDQIWATYDADWLPTNRYVCVTGSAQIAYAWWIAYRLTGKTSFQQAAKRMNVYLKTLQSMHAFDPGIQGGIPGSDPIAGVFIPPKGYCRLAIINWGTKFYLDSLMQEDLYTQTASRTPLVMGTYIIS